jgi:hypothetical protein
MNINNLTWVSIISHEYQSSHMSISHLTWVLIISHEYQSSHMSISHLTWVSIISCILYTHVRWLILMWDYWYSCEMIDTHVWWLILMWDYWYSCEIIDIHVRLLILMWDYWYSCEKIDTQSSHMSINNLMYFVLCRINHRDSKYCNNRLYNLLTIDVRLYLFLVHLVERGMWTRIT